MRVKDGVYTYDVDSDAFEEPLSVHVIETGEATLLFGGGMDDTVDAIVRIIERHDVETVVVEHGDDDHFAGVPGVLESVDVSVAIPRKDAFTLKKLNVTPDHHLDHGDMFKGVECIEIPGHTPGNMSFLYDDVLVAGDTVEGSDSIYSDNGFWGGAIDVVLEGFNTDEVAARENLQLLLEYDFDVILVTHGSNLLENGYQEVERLVEAFDYEFL